MSNENNEVLRLSKTTNNKLEEYRKKYNITKNRGWRNDVFLKICETLESVNNELEKTKKIVDIKQKETKLKEEINFEIKDEKFTNCCNCNVNEKNKKYIPVKHHNEDYFYTGNKTNILFKKLFQNQNICTGFYLSIERKFLLYT